MHANDTTIPLGYCQCGCGLATELAPRSAGHCGWVKGQPKPYLRGHRLIRDWDKYVHESSRYGPPADGLCLCGCGEGTDIAPRTHRVDGWVAGKPMPFRHGHRWGIAKPYRVDEATGCWMWQRSFNASGYGTINRHHQTLAAYRWYYERAKGPIPQGMELDHLCRTRLCVNPDHLEPVTKTENLRRGKVAKLTREVVCEIRSLKGTLSQAAVARRFGVVPTTIHHVWSRKTWADVD